MKYKSIVVSIALFSLLVGGFQILGGAPQTAHAFTIYACYGPPYDADGNPTFYPGGSEMCFPYNEQPPLPPTNVTATPGACGTGNITVSWDSVPDATAGYTVLDPWPGTTVYTGMNTSFTMSFPAGSSHSFQVESSNAYGDSAPSTPAISATAPSACAATPPEPTFAATCALQANGTYSVALTWNAVTPVTNYPVRLKGPSDATGSSPSYPIGQAGDGTDVIGWGVVGDAPTSSGLTFTGITAAGSYEYWGHAWSSTNGWSTNTIKTVSCGAAATSCTLPWGGTIADGASVTAYQSASVTSPATCTSQTRTCSNGTLSGTYTNQSCSVSGSGATGSIAGPNCTITTGASTCSTTVTWSTSGVTSAQAFQNGSSFSTSLSGSQSRTVGYTSSSFTLFDRTPSPDVQLDSDNARGTCASGSGWNGTYCELGYLPDLTAGTITPTTALTGQSTALTATVTNIGPLTTGSNFRNFIQVATAADGAGTISDLSDTSMNTLAAGASATTQRNYTFSSVGTYSARACADKRNRNDAGQIDEGSNEGNNCGAWANISVTGASCAATTISNCTLGATSSGGTSGSCVAGYGGSCAYTCNNGTWSQNSNSCAVLPTATLSASPTSINPGQTSRLTWSSTGATSCQFADKGTSDGTSGNRNVTPAVTSTYSVTCTGAGGTSAPAIATVTVLLPSLSISAVPNRVARGSSSTITWNATSVRSCSITKNGAAWRSGNANGSNIYTGSAVETINSQTIYVMSCRDVNGNPYSATATVIVNIAPDFQEF